MIREWTLLTTKESSLVSVVRVIEILVLALEGLQLNETLIYTSSLHLKHEVSTYLCRKHRVSVTKISRLTVVSKNNCCYLNIKSGGKLYFVVIRML
jgi:hypothetical protein